LFFPVQSFPGIAHLFIPIGSARDTFGDIGGKQAALKILAMDNCLITIDHSEHGRTRTITESLLSLLLESGRIKDESGASNKENRRYTRYACVMPIEFEYNEWSYKGTITNISLSGAYLETKGPFPPGKQIGIYIHSQSLDRGCRIDSRIVRRDEAGIGVEFSPMTMSQKMVLRTVVDEVA